MPALRVQIPQVNIRKGEELFRQINNKPLRTEIANLQRELLMASLTEDPEKPCTEIMAQMVLLAQQGNEHLIGHLDMVRSRYSGGDTTSRYTEASAR